MTDNDSDRRQQIMTAALNVFSRKGFAAATIKDIAKEAGVKSPALIYWYFPNKQELLATLMMEMLPIIQQVATHPQVLMELPPEETLMQVAESFMVMFSTPTGGRLVRIFLTEIGHVPEIEERVAQIQKMMLSFFAAYLQHQMDLGRMRQTNPDSAVRIFIGMLMVYALSTEIFHWLKDGIAEPEPFARQVVDTFLNGMKP